MSEVIKRISDNRFCNAIQYNTMMQCCEHVGVIGVTVKGILYECESLEKTNKKRAVPKERPFFIYCILTIPSAITALSFFETTILYFPFSKNGTPGFTHTFHSGLTPMGNLSISCSVPFSIL